MINFEFIRRRGLMVALLGAVVLSSGGCDAVNRLMEVKNPERLREQDLTSDKLVETLVNSAQGDFQAAYADPFIWVGEMLTDEYITGINWEDYKRANTRQVIYFEGPADRMFSNIQGARYTAELAYTNLSAMDPGKVTGDQMAKVLGYAGYSYIMMGDALCGADLNEGETIYTPDELYQMAIDKFTEMLTVLQSDSLRDWANVGLARAHLDRLEYADAMAAAQQVTDQGFVYWAQYVDDGTGRAEDPLYGDVHGANFTASVHPRFMYGGLASYLAGHVDDALQTDPRIQFASDALTGHDAITPLFKPYQSLPFSGYTGNTIANGAAQDDPAGVQLYQRGTMIKVASYLEAQHDYFEAGLMSGALTEAQVLQFVNDRRTVGNQPNVTLTGTALRDELREQRAKDMYLGGFRLGDLRRYARQPNPTAAHSFPAGLFPSVERGDYQDATCFPIPLSEYQGNHNLPDPHVTP